MSVKALPITRTIFADILAEARAQREVSRQARSVRSRLLAESLMAEKLANEAIERAAEKEGHGG